MRLSRRIFTQSFKGKTRQTNTKTEEPFVSKPLIPDREYKGASAKQHKGINMAHLKGTNYQMGYQHAMLYREEILQHTLPFYSNFLKKQIEHGTGEIPARILMGILDKTALKYVKSNIKKEDLEIYQGIADALDIRMNQLLWIAVAPDFLQLAGGLAAKNKLTSMFPPSLVGCTSFTAKGFATTNGNVIMAHNKDYAGMEIWDRYPTVFFCEPDGKNRYAMLGAPGFHTASLNSINEHGVSLTVHTFFTNDVSLKGEPMVFVGRRVMENATNTKEATEILAEAKFMVGWNLLVTDKNGDVATVETSASGNTVNFFDDQARAHSNIYRNAEGKSCEVSLTPAVRGNCEQRYFRMKQLISENFGNLSPEMAPAFLSDHYDMILKQDRSVGNVIAQNMNVMSSVFDLSKMKIWVADGQAPACYGTYRGFNFRDGFTDNFAEVEDYQSPYSQTKTYEGVRYYIQAEKAVMERSDYKTAATLLTKAMHCDENEFLYPFIAGVCEIFAKNYQDGLKLLEIADSINDLPQRKGLGRLWQARAYELLSDHQQARKIYKTICIDKELDTILKKAAIKGLHNKFNPKKLKVFPIDFWMGDSLFY